MRSIFKNIPATIIKTQNEYLKLYRAIGTVDIDGKGTIHSIADIDPFIFLDEATIEGEISSTFNMHPHSGMIAVTYLLAGSAHASDNISGEASDLTRPGGVYCINTGSGIVHGEKPIEGTRKVQLLQLWFLPDIHNKPLQKSNYQLFQPSEIPFIQDEIFSVKVVIGEAFGIVSPLKSPWPIQYLHVKIKGNKAKNFSLPDKSWNGFIYVIAGKGRFGANHSIASQKSCLIFGHEESDNVFVQNLLDEDLEFILVSGKPHSKQFVKLLGHGGAIIAKSEEEARKIMQTYEDDPKNFGIV